MGNGGEMQDVVGIRMENINQLLTRYKSKRAFCKAVGVQPPQFAQFFMDPSATGFRTPGWNFCRKVEDALEIPANALDQPGFVQASRKSARNQESEQNIKIGGLTTLQIAAVEELIAAFRFQAINDIKCAELISQFVNCRNSKTENT